MGFDKIAHLWGKKAPPWLSELTKPYRVFTKPARGGFAEVWFVRDATTGTKYAIKTPQERYLSNEEVMDSFITEALVWVRLGQHKNIVRVNHVDFVGGRPLIFLEYVSGGRSLREWISRRGFRRRGADDLLQEILRMAINICHGMMHACDMMGGDRFVHGDIKPENILLTEDNTAKVTDFGMVWPLSRCHHVMQAVDGVSRILRNQSPTRHAGVYGTKYYASPEQCLRNPDHLYELGVLNSKVQKPLLNSRSDIYSFGCLLYAMLSGRPPFWNGGWKPDSDVVDEDHLARVLYEQPRLLSVGHEGLASLISRCLEKRPNDRVPSFRVLEDELQRMLYGLCGTRVPHRESNPLGPIDLFNAALSYSNLGRNEEAVDYYTQAIVLSAGDAELYCNRGVCYRDLGMASAALSDFNMAIQMNPEHSITYNERGLLYHGVSEYEKALGDFDRALDLDPEFAEAYNNRGVSRCNCHSPDYSRAIADFTTSLAIRSASHRTYVNRGRAYLETCENGKAIRDFTTALKFDACCSSAFNLRGIAYAVIEQYQRAIDDFSRAVECDEGNVEAYMNRGRARCEVGQHDSALADFNRVKSMAPERPDVHHAIGVLFYALGHKGRSELAFAEASRLRARAQREGD